MVSPWFTDQNIAGALIVPHAVFSFLATVFLGLRLYTARVINKTGWHFDEVVAVVAVFANHVMLICEGIGTSYGWGMDMVDVALLPHGVTGFLQTLKSGEISYGIACPLSKLAVLTMFYRVFSTSKPLRYCLLAVASMITAWGIAVVLVSIFSCTPVSGFWDKTIEAKCVDSGKFYIGITVPNIIFDILTVGLPIHEIWKLQMGRSKKLAITCVFLLGGTVVLASIARLVLFSIYQPGGGEDGNNVSRTVVIPHSASAIETCLALIGSCLPPSAPLFVRAKGAVQSKLGSGNKSGNNSNAKSHPSLVTVGKISHRGGPRRGEDDLEGGFTRLDEEDAGSLQGSTDGLYAADGKKKMVERSSNPGGIMMQRELQIKRDNAPEDYLQEHKRQQQWRQTDDIPMSRVTTVKSKNHLG